MSPAARHGPAGDERPLAVVDIDGVVADVRHRLHHLRRGRKDWAAFFAAAPADPPHPEGIAVVERLRVDHDIVFLTGRPEHLRDDTTEWLHAHGLGGHGLVMRPVADRRPAAALKAELIARLATIAPIGMVVDDDPDVIAAATRAGLPTLHADWETRAPADERTLSDARARDGRT